MKFGVVFPQLEIGSDPVVIKDYVQTAEALGYDYLLIYDHVLGANPDRPGGWRGPYTYQSMFHEPFVLFGYLAALTQKIELVTGIIILPQRQTALVAKQAAQVDVLSGGRLRLGVGIGWNQVEYEALNRDFSTRGRRIEEQVTLLRQLWTEPLITFQGQDHTISDAGLNPLPIQQPIPVWFGGMADVVLQRIARMGDGWITTGTLNDRLRERTTRLRQYLTDNNRDPATFGIDGRISLSVVSPAGWPAEITAWRDLGASHLAFNTMGAGLDSPQAHIKMIEQFSKELK